MKLQAFGLVIIKNSHFSKVKRTDSWHHIGRLHDLDELFQPCSDFKRSLDKYNLLEVPSIHKHLVWRL